MTPNDVEYQKSVRLKFRYCLELSQFAISILMTCKTGEDRLGNRPFSHVSVLCDLDLDLGSDHTAHTVMYQSSASTYVLNFVRIGKNFCGQTDIRLILGGVDLKIKVIVILLTKYNY